MCDYWINDEFYPTHGEESGPAAVDFAIGQTRSLKVLSARGRGGGEQRLGGCSCYIVELSNWHLST